MGIVETVESEIKRRATERAERDGAAFRADLVQLMERNGAEPLYRGSFAVARSVDEFVRVRTQILERNMLNASARRLIGDAMGLTAGGRPI